jgi:hypothetical protein
LNSWIEQVVPLRDHVALTCKYTKQAREGGERSGYEKVKKWLRSCYPHDAWVVGDEPFVGLDFISAPIYGKPKK